MQICEIQASEKKKTIQICENGKKLDYGSYKAYVKWIVLTK